MTCPDPANNRACVSLLQQWYAQQGAVFSINPALYANAVQQLMSPYERDYAEALVELDVEFPGYREDD